MLKRASLVVTFLFVTVALQAADDRLAQRLALCQDSWLDWKDDPVKVKQFGDQFQAAYTQSGQDPFFVPRTSATILGFAVEKVFPESVGMAVGFSVIVKAGFDAARKSVEKAIGKTFKNCESSDHMRTCDLELAPKRVVTLLTEDGRPASSLIGCYYYYAK